MSKRILVTGARGFVAGSVVLQAGVDRELHAVSRGEALVERENLYWHKLDICDTEALRTLFAEIQPVSVIHAAAIADIDYCEAHPDEADRVNVKTTSALAGLCRSSGAKLVFCSTDTVFDGKRGQYREEDAPGPLNVYAETKVRAEAVTLKTDGSVVARLALVMGLPVLGVGNSFLSRMMDSFEAGRAVGVPANEIRTPIDVITLGRALLELAENDFSGILHLAGNDRLNRFDMVRRIAAHLGYGDELVEPNDPSGIPDRAPRPLDASLNNAKARRELATPMVGLAEGLELVLQARRELAS